MKQQAWYRVLNVLSLTMGMTLTPGLFLLPGQAFTTAGPAVWLAYFLAGITAGIGVLNLAELCTVIPDNQEQRAGGDECMAYRFGPLCGTILGILHWLALSAQSAFALAGIIRVIHALTGFSLPMIAVVMCLLLPLVTIRKISVLEIGIMGGGLLFLGYYTVFGIPHANIAHFTPFMAQDSGVILTTAGLVFISFGGLLNATRIAGYVRPLNKHRTIGLSLFVISVVALQMLLVGVTVGVAPPASLNASLMPLAETMRVIAGKTGFIAATILTLLLLSLSFVLSSLFASRYTAGLSHAHLAPSILGIMPVWLNTSVGTLLLTGILLSISFIMPFEMFARIASAVVLILSIFVCSLILMLRANQVADYQPDFRAPGYPYLQVIGLGFAVLLLVQMGKFFIELSLGLLLVGVVLYGVYGRKKAHQEDLLLHLVKQIADQQLIPSASDSELRRILYHSDEMATDPFIQRIEHSPISDILGAVEVKEAFDFVTRYLAEETSLPQSALLTWLLEREQQSSTVITPFVAIPHLVIEGAQIFHLFIARCQQGIRFSSDHPAVKAMFVIIGTKDARDRHLQTLAAIARIVQEESFEKKWTMASSEQQLRDLLIVLRKKTA